MTPVTDKRTVKYAPGARHAERTTMVIAGIFILFIAADMLILSNFKYLGLGYTDLLLCSVALAVIVYQRKIRVPFKNSKPYRFFIAYIGFMGVYALISGSRVVFDSLASFENEILMFVNIVEPLLFISALVLIAVVIRERSLLPTHIYIWVLVSAMIAALRMGLWLIMPKLPTKVWLFSGVADLILVFTWIVSFLKSLNYERDCASEPHRITVIH